MIKGSFNFSPQQIEDLVDRLPMREKMKLVRKLEKETLKARWKSILKSIDQRLKRFPVTEKDIAQEIKDYRKEKYAKRRH